MFIIKPLNMASVAEKWNLKFHLILINLNYHTWVALLYGTAQF